MTEERTTHNDESQFGTLVMRSYNIAGNVIDAFYDSSDDLIFVLDKTMNTNKPNVLLVINPDGDKKWDEILAGQYDVDLETIRPKQDNKYQKLDIEYSGLSVYENLINTYAAYGDLEDSLAQLNILRDSAARHSAMARLDAANETISKTNVTIVKTKESIVRLQERVKTLRAKLSDAKKEIGRVSTKKSAAKILRIESQIEAANEKLKRAKKRLESAQKRLETATVDAELASDLLNQPVMGVPQTTKSEPLMVAPKYEMQKTEPIEDTESNNQGSDEMFDKDIETEEENTTTEEEFDSDIKPLLKEDPQIVNDDIAFKPIDFSVPEPPVSLDTESNVSYPELKEEAQPEKPVLETFVSVPDFNDEKSEPEESFEIDNSWQAKTDFSDPDKESFEHFDTNEIHDIENKEIFEDQNSQTYEQPEKPIVDMVRPVPPFASESQPVPPVVPPVQFNEPEVKSAKPTAVYYFLLLLLIGVSVFVLWLYQKNIITSQPTGLVVDTPTVVQEEQPKPIVVDELIKEQDEEEVEEVSIEETPETETEPAQYEEPEVEDEIEEDVSVSEPQKIEEPEEPVVMGDVSAKVSAFAEPQEFDDIEEPKRIILSEEEILARKPAYGTGDKYKEMFVYEEDGVEEEPADEYGFVETDEPDIIYQSKTETVSHVQQNNEVHDETPMVHQKPISQQSVQKSLVEEEPLVSEEYVDHNNEYDDEEVVFYDDEYFDPEEAAYQAGDDGYDRY